MDAMCYGIFNVFLIHHQLWYRRRVGMSHRFSQVLCFCSFSNSFLLADALRIIPDFSTGGAINH